MEIFANTQLHKNERKREGGREGGKVEGRRKRGGRREEGRKEGTTDEVYWQSISFGVTNQMYLFGSMHI